MDSFMNRIRRGVGKGVRGGEEGNAYAEAVVMLPVFVLVWASLLFAKDGFGAAINGASDARTVGWNHSISNCERRPRGRGVRVQSLGGGPLGEFAAVLNIVMRVARMIPFLRRYIPGGDPRRVFALQEYQYTARERIRRPRPMRGRSTAGHSMALMCNEEPTDLDLYGLAVLFYAYFGLS